MRRIAYCLAIALLLTTTVACRQTKKTRTPSPAVTQDYGYYESLNARSNAYADIATNRDDTRDYPEPEVRPANTQMLAGTSEPSPPAAGSRYHVVGKGDSLYKLARQYYGNQARWKEIFEANRGTLSDPDRIFVGQKLMIP